MLSFDKESALDIFDQKIQFAWEHYPANLKELYKLDTKRANKLKFDFGKGIYSEISVRNRGRSGTYNRVHISEFGKICKESKIKAREIITGTIPSVPSDGRIDIESTAEGEEGDFHDMFWEAWNRGEPTSPYQFKAHFYNWTWDKEQIAKVPLMDVPKEFADYRVKHNLSEREISFYYQIYLSIGSDWRRLKQEYPTTPEEAFIYSGFKMFDPAKVELQKQYEKMGEAVNDWIYYDQPKASHFYALGVDVAEGVGQDSSVIHIIDFACKTPRLVAEYCSDSIEPDMLAYEAKRGAVKYNDALIAVERNNHGHATLVKLKEIYSRIYKEIKEDKFLNTTTEKLGWLTTIASKPKMMYGLNDAINEELIEIPSRATVSELRSYDKTDLSRIRYDPEQTKHWDRVMALAIAWQMKSHVFAAPVPGTIKFEKDKWGRSRVVKKTLHSGGFGL